MKEVELVVKIPEEIYKRILPYRDFPLISNLTSDSLKLTHAVANGVPLPKGHGRLIDADAFIAMMEDASKKHKYKELLIDDRLTVDDVFKAIIESLLNEGLAEGDAPTIIEADRSEES